MQLNGKTLKKLIDSKKSLVGKVRDVINSNGSDIKIIIALQKLDNELDIERSRPAMEEVEFFESGLKFSGWELKKIFKITHDSKNLSLKEEFFRVKNESKGAGYFRNIESRRYPLFARLQNEGITFFNSFLRGIQTNSLDLGIRSAYEGLNPAVKEEKKTNNMIRKLKSKIEFKGDVYELLKKAGAVKIKDDFLERRMDSKKIYKLIVEGKNRERKQERKERLFKFLYGEILQKYIANTGFGEYWINIIKKVCKGDKNLLIEAKKHILKQIKIEEKYGRVFPLIQNIGDVRENKKGYAYFADCVVNVDYKEDVDWNYYAKSYGRPKVTIYDRTVTFYKKGLVKKIELDSFRGDFILKAYIEAFSVRKYKQKGRARKVQLNDFLRAKKIRTICGVEIWERTLNKINFDYVAVKKETTFHASTIKDAVKGLKNKIEYVIKENMEIINKQVGIDLGFCITGMENFCEDNKISIEDSFTREDLSKIINKNKSMNLAKYKNELKTLKVI